MPDSTTRGKYFKYAQREDNDNIKSVLFFDRVATGFDQVVVPPSGVHDQHQNIYAGHYKKLVVFWREYSLANPSITINLNIIEPDDLFSFESFKVVNVVTNQLGNPNKNLIDFDLLTPDVVMAFRISITNPNNAQSQTYDLSYALKP